MALEQGPVLGELMQDASARRARTRFVLPAPADDDVAQTGDTDSRSLRSLWRYLRALHAGFAVDATVKLFAPEGG